MLARQIFGTVGLIFAGTFAVATYAWKLQFLSLFQWEHATVTSFAIAGVFFLPFVVTFTQLGLNTTKAETPSPETERRLKSLSSHCRMWPMTWYLPLGFVGISWLAFLLENNSSHPLFAMSAALTAVSGAWFLFVYPMAHQLFKDLPQELDFNRNRR